MDEPPMPRRAAATTSDDAPAIASTGRLGPAASRKGPEVYGRAEPSAAWADRLASILEVLDAPVALMCGPEMVYTYVNARYVDLVGGRNVLGHKFVDALPELRRQDFAAILRQVLQTGVAHVERSRPARYICTPGGPPEDRYIDIVHGRVDGPTGEPYGVCVSVTDVTDQVRARAQIADSVRARDDFLSFCSHELKNPLAALKLSTQGLRRRLDPSAVGPGLLGRLLQALQHWDDNIARMLRLIDDMADFSRVNRGLLRLQRGPCALDGVAAEVLDRLGPLLRADGVVVTSSLQPVHGSWDGPRLEQVCSNLLTNAHKYGAGANVHVTVRKEKGRALLEVHDQGPGIDPLDLQRIFLAYERASTAHEGRSLGIGLFLSQRIVEAHGGSLRAVSAPGFGTTFTVELPDGKGIEGPANVAARKLGDSSPSPA